MRRQILLFSSAWLAATMSLAGEAKRSSLEEILALNGKDLFVQAERLDLDSDPEFSTADLLAITGKLLSELKNLPKNDSSTYALNLLFEAACKKVRADEIDQLCQIYERLDGREYEKSALLEPLAVAWLNRELGRLPKEIQIKLPAIEVSLPSELKECPAQMADSFTMYKRAVAAYEKIVPSLEWESKISYQKNQRTFYALIDDVLAGRGENEMDYEKHSYRGLTAGNYVLHIPSTEELRTKYIGELQAGPEEVAYKGRDVAFTISDNSPPVIDLGQIRLDPILK